MTACGLIIIAQRGFSFPASFLVLNRQTSTLTPSASSASRFSS
jgi:hypothetical protein